MQYPGLRTAALNICNFKPFTSGELIFVYIILRALLQQAEYTVHLLQMHLIGYDYENYPDFDSARSYPGGIIVMATLIEVGLTPYLQ